MHLHTQIVALALTTALASAREQITSLGHTVNPLTPRTRTTLTRARSALKRGRVVVRVAVGAKG